MGRFFSAAIVSLGSFLFVMTAPRAALAAPLFEESFSNLAGRGDSSWEIENRSSPIGDFTWQYGPVNGDLRSRNDDHSIMAVSYDTAGVGPNAIASNWLFLPEVPLENGQRFTFDTIGTDGEGFPDRMQVRLNPFNNGTYVGDEATTVGDFSLLLLDINPGYASYPESGAYPIEWTTYSIDLYGITTPGVGRLAFRYFVEDAGPEGSRGTEIAIDDVRLDALPEPSLLLSLSLAGLLVCRRPRRRSR